MEKEMRKSKLRMPTALRDKEHKLTKMLLIIFICFLLSYGPGMVCKLVRIRSIETVKYNKLYDKIILSKIQI